VTIGIILQGGLYNTLIRALELLGLADSLGADRLPLYVLNVTYPLIESESSRSARQEGVLIVEEGQPEYLEQNVNSILRRRGCRDARRRQGCVRWRRIHRRCDLRGVRHSCACTRPIARRATRCCRRHRRSAARSAALAPLLPIRPAVSAPAALSGRSSLR
jgi:hypothetical protein